MARELVVVAPRRVDIVEKPDPPLERGFVRIRSLYLGVSAGTELNTYRGGVNWHSGRDPATGVFHRDQSAGAWKYPATLGYGNVGEVSEVAPGVEGLAIGDLVFSFGRHATSVVQRGDGVHKVPSGESARRYTLYALVRTGLTVVLHARLTLGENVAVFGLGSVGLLALQVCRRAGARRIVVFDPIPRRRELALQLGADAAFDPRESEPAEAVRRVVGPRGADVAIECSAHPDALREAPRAVGRQGRVVIGSMPSKASEFHFGQEVHFSAIQLTGANVMCLPRELGPAWDLERRDALARELIPQLTLDPLITHEVPFERAADAFRMLDTDPGEIVSLVLRCDGAPGRGSAG